jgi:hypothetical protein
VSLSADERGRSRNRLRVVTENRSDGLDSRSFSRIEFLRLAYQHLPVSGRMILMASKLALSESLAWWTRAAQVRRIASMLPPRDAKLAEAYAVECEHQPERFLPKAPGREALRLDRSVQSIQTLSPFDAPHPSKLRSCVLDEPRPSSIIFEVIKRVLWRESVTSR